MRKAIIKYGELIAGILTERDQGDYIFEYASHYIQNNPQNFITFTMPVQNEPFISERLFPFFEGLIPEGWLLNIATKNWKLNPNDRMGLLLACCQNCVGAVSVHQIIASHE